MDNLLEHVAESGMGQKLLQKAVKHELESQGPSGLMNLAESAFGGGDDSGGHSSSGGGVGGVGGGLMGMARNLISGGGHHDGSSHRSYDDNEGHHRRREERHFSGDEHRGEHGESHDVEEDHLSRDDDGNCEESHSHSHVEQDHSEGHGGLSGMASNLFHSEHKEKKSADPTGEIISQALDFAREKVLHQTGVEKQDDQIGEALAGYAHKFMEDRS